MPARFDTAETRPMTAQRRRREAWRRAAQKRMQVQITLRPKRRRARAIAISFSYDDGLTDMTSALQWGRGSFVNKTIPSSGSKLKLRIVIWTRRVSTPDVVCAISLPVLTHCRRIVCSSPERSYGGGASEWVTRDCPNHKRPHHNERRRSKRRCSRQTKASLVFVIAPESWISLSDFSWFPSSCAWRHVFSTRTSASAWSKSAGQWADPQRGAKICSHE